MKPSDEFREQLLAAIPGLRAFGMSLTARVDHADDPVQETFMKAWDHYTSYGASTNIRAWLYPPQVQRRRWPGRLQHTSDARWEVANACLFGLATNRKQIKKCRLL